MAGITAHEASVASFLAELGFSYRGIAKLLGSTDKTVKAAIESGAEPLPDAIKLRAQSFADLMRWLEEGESKGFTAIVIAHNERMSVYSGRSGRKVAVKGSKS